MNKLIWATALGLAAVLGAQTIGSGGGAMLSGLATNNNRLITVADGINQGGGTTDLRIDGWGDGTSTSYGAALVAAQMSAYNGSGSFDRLRTSTADGSAKTGVLETAAVESYSHISSAATTAVKAAGGVLHKVTINTPAAGTVSLYDLGSGGCTGTPGSGEVAAITLTSASQPMTLSYDVKTSNGICVVTSAAMDVTVSYE